MCAWASYEILWKHLLINKIAGDGVHYKNEIAEGM